MQYVDKQEQLVNMVHQALLALQPTLGHRVMTSHIQAWLAEHKGVHVSLAAIKQATDDMLDADERLEDKTFLQRVLEEMDGFDGVLSPEEMYRFIKRRDGFCSYTLEEIATWLVDQG